MSIFSLIAAHECEPCLKVNESLLFKSSPTKASQKKELDSDTIEYLNIVL